MSKDGRLGMEHQRNYVLVECEVINMPKLGKKHFKYDKAGLAAYKRAKIKKKKVVKKKK